MKQLFIFLAVLSSLYSEAYYQDDIDVEEAFELYQDGAVIIDVRTPSEFIYTGHGLGHINVPVLYQDFKPKPIRVLNRFAQMESKKGEGLNSRKLYKISVRDNKDFFKNVMYVTEGDLEIELIVICHSGERSKYAANLLSKKGFENVYNLDGGFLAWQENSYPWAVD